jgi:hypothetical protein
MATSLGRYLGASLVCILLAPVAMAGPLATDPAAIPGWTGSTPFAGTNASLSHTVNAVVDFAVYAPGQFSTSLALGNPADISGGTQYIYAYEMFRTGNDADLAALTINLVPNAVPNNSTLAGFNTTTPEGGPAPLSANFVPGTIGLPRQSVRWNYVPAISGNGHSAILLFASPYGPQFLNATVGGTFTTAALALLPTPVPEPATGLLALLGIGLLISVHRLRRR